MSYALDLTVKERSKEAKFVRFHTAVTTRNDARRRGSLVVLRTPFGLESAGLIGNVKGDGQNSSGKQSDLVLLPTVSGCQQEVGFLYGATFLSARTTLNGRIY
jgi:hypothetical protein